MQLAQLRRPVQAAALSATGYRPVVLTSFTLPIRPAIQPSSIPENRVEGRRYASVKAQGAYRIPNKKTIAKKLGAKRTGDQFVIPGNIIFKQRGTIWHAGENAIRGRDHTIHAAVEGYVKYYRDPERHPDKQYIGVAFNKEDTLPYPRNEPRRRKLNMVAVTRKTTPRPDDLTASGLPRRVTMPGNVFDVQAMRKLEFVSREKARQLRHGRYEKLIAGKVEAEAQATLEAANATAIAASTDDTSVDTAANTEATDATADALDEATGEVAPETKKTRRSRAEQRGFVHPLEFIQKRWLERRRTRTLHINKLDYSYAETNAAIGRLPSRTMYTPPWKLGGRKSRFRSKRRNREKALEKKRKEAAETRLLKKQKKIAEEKKRAARLAKQIAAGAGKSAGGKEKKPLPVEGNNNTKPE